MVATNLLKGYIGVMEPVWSRDEVEGPMLGDERVIMHDTRIDSQLLASAEVTSRTCVGMIDYEDEDDDHLGPKEIR